MTKKLKLQTRKLRNKKIALVFVVGFAAIGVTMVLFASAATEKSFIELESNTVSGNATIVSDSSAAGGKAIQFNEPVLPPTPTPPTTPTPTTPSTGACTATTPTSSVCLPFDMPTTAALRASNKKVFAHYMTAWPLSDRFDCYLTPQCEGNRYVASGGYLRDKPLLKSSGSQKADIKSEINQAMAAGIDGFIVNISSYTTDDHWKLLLDTLSGVNESSSGFKIVLMPDMVTMNKHSATELAGIIAQVANDPALYRLSDGSVVISPFSSDFNSQANAPNPLTYWPLFISTLKNNYNVKVAFVPTWVSGNLTYQNWASFSYGYSSFGSHSPIPSYLSAAKTVTDTSHNQGKIWMQPVSVQDYRARSGSYYEAGNTELLRTSWQAANNGADWIQYVTWNDYGENSNMAPSNASSWNALDISAYYLAKFKTGIEPTIKRDTMYLTHRKQPYSAKGSGPMTSNAGLRSGGAGVTIPARDTIEVLSFLTAPARVDVKANGVIIGSCNAKAGVDVCTVALKTGKISAEAVRNSAVISTVVSSHTVASSLYTQDLRYEITSSRRQN